MKNIKCFELFDSKEVKSKNYLDYKSGFPVLGSVDKNFKTEDKWDVILKLAKYDYPFFAAFLGNEIEFKGFEIYTIDTTEVDKNLCILGSESEYQRVLFAIKIRNSYKYDVYININDKDSVYEHKGISYRELVKIIKGEYIPILKGLGFGELVNDIDEVIN